MSQTEAQHVIDEVVTQLKASFEPRFDRVESDVKGLKENMKGLEVDMKGLETGMRGLETDMKGLKTGMQGLEVDMKGLKHRMLTLEESVEDMRMEQRLIRQAAISNLSDITRLTDRLQRG